MIWRWEVVAGLLDNPKTGAEIGVKKGQFTEYMLSKFRDLHMIAVDPWEEQPEGNETYTEWDFGAIYSEFRNRTNGFRDRLTEIRKYSQGACRDVEDGSLDFVFIDAQHDYESVKRDIMLWAPKVKPGGLLSGHDYCPRFPGVVRAVDESVTATPAGNDVWWTRC